MNIQGDHSSPIMVLIPWNVWKSTIIGKFCRTLMNNQSGHGGPISLTK